MKLFKNLTAAALLLFIAGLWACGPKENTITTTITPDREYAKVGDTVSVSLSLSSEIEDLKSFNVTVNASDSLNNQIEVFTLNADASGLTADTNFTFVVPEAAGIGSMISMEVSSTDAVDGEFSEMAEIEVVSYFSVFRANASMGHKFSTFINRGYNLVDAIEVYNDAPNNTKDMVDNSTDTGPLSKSVSANSASNTEYVNLGNSYDINSLHSGNVEEIFAERNASTVAGVETGTNLLAKCRGGSKYVLVVFTNIDADYQHRNEEDNMGIYEFDIYQTK